MITSFARRARNFYARAQWVETFLPGPVAAVSCLLRARRYPATLTTGRYNDFAFSFRGCDVSALKEVLVDAEYGFLTDAVKSLHFPVILDVGAHIGLFSLWALHVNPTAQITSVEASPGTFRILECNVGLVQKAGWNAINRAAWKDDDTIRFAEAADSMSHRVSATGGTEVKGISLTALTEGLADIDLMKVDIEGAEEAFLCVDPAALAPVKRLVVELHPQLCDTQRVRGVLQKAFPQIVEIQGRISSKPLLYCRKRGVSP